MRMRQRAEHDRVIAGELPANFASAVNDLKTAIAGEAPKIATRQSSQKVIEALAPIMPEFIGGSADLTGSNNTKAKNAAPIKAGAYGGSYIYYGIREHEMAAAMNGLALHGGVIPFGGTFLVFTDYCRPSIRLSALMHQRVIYVMTHDSIGLGEDGPTHQPVEHLAALRAIPNLLVFRPADTMETAECWALALSQKNRPSILALTRQALPHLRADAAVANHCARGGYVIRPAKNARKATLIATGSEVSLAVEAREALEAQGHRHRRRLPALLGIVRRAAGELSPRSAGRRPARRDRSRRRLRLGALYRRRWRVRRHARASAPPRPPRNSTSISALPLRPLSSRSRPSCKPKQKRTKMTVKVAINGFGRIGRLVLRAIIESGRKDIEVLGLNDLGPVETNAHLFRYDTVHGRFPGEVKTKADQMDVGRGFMKVTAERDPSKLPWKDLGVDIALECTGLFTAKDKASAHLAAGAKRVLISAPGTDVDLTVVYGVNHQKLEKSHTVVSNASCTTNCLAPVVHVLHNAFGIQHGYMTTIHSYTGDQPTLDTMHKDLYRARAAALNMIPTTTGAAKAIGLVIPDLKGKLDGTSIRVPTPNVSLVDFKFVPKKSVTKEAVNAAILEAANGPLKGILATNDQPLVSMDFNHNPASSTFDLLQTQVIDGTFVRVMTWYDNEWGFSNRMGDTAVAMGKLG